MTTGVHWTMTAEAKEYRESLAIDKAIQDNPAEREAWIKRQSRLRLMATSLTELAKDDGEEE